MTRTTRASITIKIAVTAVCLVCVCLAPTTAAAASKNTSASAGKLTQESMQAYEQQLASGQIEVVRFNEKARAMHVTLNDGRHLRVSYARGGEPKLRAALLAKGVSVPALKKPTVHHTLRYVAAGVLVVVVLIVIGAVVMIRRRRREERY